MNINENFAKMPGSYLFSEIAARTEKFVNNNPDKKLIRLGIGDVTLPLADCVIDAMKAAVDDLSKSETFHGYGPSEGIASLRGIIAKSDFIEKGIDISADEVFVSDGAKTDCSNIVDLFSLDNIIAVCDPVYPVYVDSNVIAGRGGTYDASTQKWSDIVYMPTTSENDFVPAIPGRPADVVYLCSPNNPTGTVLNYDQLKTWVDWANERGALLLFDAAYERFIDDSEGNIPHSIFEVEGAKTCAIEFKSFSKTAGFTGVRLGYCVIPNDLTRSGQNLNKLWSRRQNTKFNGASYIVQKGAESVYTDNGKAQIEKNILYYKNNARIIKEGLESVGLQAYGGIHSPYVWCKTPAGVGSWEFFDELLQKCYIVTTPGAGFGPSGEGYIRLTGFGTHDNTSEAVSRIKKLFA